MRLAERVAVVTGSGGGIGRAIVLRLAQEGADVVVADVRGDAAAETAGMVEGLGRKALPMAVDVTDRQQVRQMVDRTVEAFGKLDILVNNAGGSMHYPRAGEEQMDRLARLIPTEEAPEDFWDYIVDLNLKGTFLCSQAAIRAMKRQGTGGCIVNIASIFGRTATAISSGPAYAAAKGGVISLTRHMASELATAGIRVNAVAPGLVATERVLRLSVLPGASVDDHARTVPMKRSSKPEEQAAAVAFLASDDASYITGAALDVNGGWFMG